MREIIGREVVAGLAETYFQLYVKPGEENSEQEYKDIVMRGKEPLTRSLSHFILDDRDRLTVEETLAGEVSVITLFNRKDFETFLKIMAGKCCDITIPPTQGASFLNGVINRRKIEAHKKEFLISEHLKGNTAPDWKSEFARFTSVKENYKDALIVLSTGPYSGVDVSQVASVISGINGISSKSSHEKNGYIDSPVLTSEDWIRLSDTIRRVHECTHFICRKLYPDKIDEIWDELVADAAGVYAAFGKYIPEMVELFLGIGPISDKTHFSGNEKEESMYGYIGGRLKNYVKENETDEKLDILAGKIHMVLERFREKAQENGTLSPLEFALRLEELHSTMCQH